MAPSIKSTDDLSKKLKSFSLSAMASKLKDGVRESRGKNKENELIHTYLRDKTDTEDVPAFTFYPEVKHTIFTDFSRQDFERLERLVAEEPECVQGIDTLCTNAKFPKKKQEDENKREAMGTGYTWERLTYGALDMDQPLIKQWHALLGRFGNLKHIGINTTIDGYAPKDDYRRSCAEISDSEAFMITMLFVRNSKLPVASLDICGWNLYTGFKYGGLADEEREHESGIVQTLFTGPEADWPHLESLTIRSGLCWKGDRFQSLVLRSPNLKRLTLAEVRAGMYLRDLANNGEKITIEEFNLVRDTISCMDNSLSFYLQQFLKSQRKTMKRLALSHANVGPCMKLLELLKTDGFSALEEITLDKVEEYTCQKQLHFAHSPGKPLVSGPPGGKLSWGLYQFRDTKYYSTVSYSGPGMEDVLGQLAQKARVIQTGFGVCCDEGVDQF
ncbi:hypothetical protein BJY00DRAFT_310362 [Aspergillus carlsbadensis]|nr:hypothetical protein BJY00DRAFT_310362 [Aspergillus carlsbadensis]